MTSPVSPVGNIRDQQGHRLRSAISCTAVVTARLPDETALLDDTITFWASHLSAVPTLQVILVTNGATLDHVRVTAVNEYGRFLHLDASAISDSKSANLNAALDHVDTQVVAFFDTDSRPSRQALHLGPTEALADTSSPVQGAKIVTQSNPKTFSSLVAYNLARIEYRINYVVAGGLLRERAGRSTYFAGSNGFFARGRLSDREFRTENISEDLDLSARIYFANDRIRYLPSAVATESPPSTMRAYCNQHTRWVAGWLGTLRCHGVRLLSSPASRRTWAPILLWPFGVYLLISTFALLSVLRYGFAVGAIVTYTLITIVGFSLARAAARRLARRSIADTWHQRLSDALGASLLPVYLVVMFGIAFRSLVSQPSLLHVTEKRVPRRQ